MSSTPITHAPVAAAGGQMVARPNTGGQTVTVASRYGNEEGSLGLIKTPGQGSPRTSGGRRTDDDRITECRKPCWKNQEMDFQWSMAME